MKLDENLGTHGTEIFKKHGHDVLTVVNESMESATDTDLIDMCRRERRCLVTMDLDFSNPLVFPPNQYARIAVLRLPSQATPVDLYLLTEKLSAVLKEAATETV